MPTGYRFPGSPLGGGENIETLPGQSQTLDEVEQAVEQWRRQALPQLESDLLQAAQTQFTQELKKTEIHFATATEASG